MHTEHKRKWGERECNWVNQKFKRSQCNHNQKIDVWNKLVNAVANLTKDKLYSKLICQKYLTFLKR